jgi:hypothetical protein
MSRHPPQATRHILSESCRVDEEVPVPIVFAGIVLTAFSVFSLWGGTSVPVGALMVALGVGVTFFGVIGMVRSASDQDEPPGEATSPHRSD